MAEEFNESGYNAVALTGSNDLGQRIKAFNDLQDDSNPLEIICAVDILNEGVDIPKVNMVLFLRPTESQTIFLQQLGRGLRKADGKPYVTILDFIGNNYNRSVQIAMALGTLGQSTIMEKQYLVDMIRNDFVALNIPGVEIHIDALSKEEIIDYVRSTNFNTKTILATDYENFKKYLKKDTYPLHIDYLNNDCAPDLLRFIKSSISNKNNSYYTFLQKIGEQSLPVFSKEQIKMIDNLSELLPLVRVDEYIIVNQLLNDGLNIDELINYNSKVTKDTLNHALKHLKQFNIINDNNELIIQTNDVFIDFINDLVSYGLERYDIEFGDYEGNFKLYGNYYSEQIQMVKLRSFSPYMRGTEFDTINNETYCYVTLKKDASVEERLNYKDKFLTPSLFQWESVKNTTFTTGDGPKLLATKKVHLFVRKIKEEDGIVLPFTYFGTGKFVNPRESFTTENDIKHNTLLFDIELDNAVPEEYWFDFNINK